MDAPAGTGGRPHIPYLNESPAGPAAPPPFAEDLFGTAPRGQQDVFGGPAGPSAGPPDSDPFAGRQPSAGTGRDNVPTGPTTGPGTGGMPVPPPTGRARVGQGPSGRAPGGFRPVGTIGTGPGTAGPRDSGDTLVGAVATVPQEPEAEVPPVPAPSTPGPPGRVEEAYHFEADEPDGPAPRGRSKMILAAVAVVAVGSIAYGAGLLMNHSDVPRGTTVLGVEIGGKSKEEAVKALGAALGDRTTEPLALTIGGEGKELRPARAGLAIDIDATVGSVARSDYNPITVIGSLFGGTTVSEPVLTVDEEKLRVELESLASGGAATEGMVKFEDGESVPVPGEAYSALDVESSLEKVEAAYREHAGTGRAKTTELKVTEREPKVGQAQFDRGIKKFGDSAMAGLVTVRVDAAHTIQFGPTKSLPKFLSLRPDADGELQYHFDLKVLESLYGGTFDGVLVERGNGSLTAVTPEDVATAMVPALRETDPAKKTVTIEGAAQ